MLATHAKFKCVTAYQRIIGLKMGKVLFDVPAENVSPDMIEQLYRYKKERQQRRQRLRR
ncbi:MAG: hypothetical protein RIM23_02180 [Coleofasciculus sp. G3-WIS-01]